MSEKPTIDTSEQLEKSPINDEPLMHFPHDFALKVMGLNIDNYSAYVLSVCKKHVVGITDDCIHTRPSRNGKYLAVTVKLIATSRNQLDDLYSELNANERTKMAL